MRLAWAIPPTMARAPEAYDANTADVHKRYERKNMPLCGMRLSKAKVEEIQSVGQDRQKLVRAWTLWTESERERERVRDMVMQGRGG